MKTIFEKWQRDDNGFTFAKLDVPDNEAVPEKFLRKSLELPIISEPEVIRHYTTLSKRNFGVDLGFYPLGSCTMKYNPKINEDVARLAGFTELHPYMPQSSCQGAMQLMYELTDYLKEIAGMDAVTLQPAAGSHGEFTGMMVMKNYFQEKGASRNKVLIPDSAHGTNPATVTMSGLTCVQVKSNQKGTVDLDDLRNKMDKDVVGIMLTNPNTLGLFEEDILEVIRIVHDKGGLAYCDGANLNAIMGLVRPGDLGFDVIHFNLHKSFSTPHGCGGPGAGPIGVKEFLKRYLPNPSIEKEDEIYRFFYSKDSIGKVKAFYGNFGMLVRAYTYIRGLGSDGIRLAAERAVLNANYMKERLKPHYHLTYDRICQHEFVIDDSNMPNGVTTNDIAKRLLDFGFHAPTVYFPLIVQGAMMIEPTETETKETLDQFIDALIQIKHEAENEPDKVKNAPWTTPVKRVDAVKAAREVDITYCTICS